MRPAALPAVLAFALASAGCAYHSATDANGLLDVAEPQANSAPLELRLRSTPPSPGVSDSPDAKVALVIPLLPWISSVEETRNPDHYPAGYLVDQIRKSRLVQDVRMASESDARGVYRLDVSVAQSEIRETTTAYGLSVAGAVFQILTGLPSQSRSAELAIALKLTDPGGGVLLEKRYATRQSRLGGVWAPLWMYGPQFTYGQHANLMARSAETLTREILADLRRVLTR